MPTSVTKRFNAAGGAGVDYQTEASVASYINGLDLIALDQDVTVYIDGTFNFASAMDMGPKTSDNTHRVRLMGDPSTGVNAQQRTVFDKGSTGGAVAFSRNNSYAPGLQSGLDLIDLRILITGTSGGTTGAFYTATRNASSTWDNIIQRCRIYDSSLAPYASTTGVPIRFGVSGSLALFTDNLIVIDSAASKTAMTDNTGSLIARNTFVAIGAASGNATAIRDYYNGPTIRNNAFINFAEVFSTTTTSAHAGNNFANVAPTSGRAATSGILTVASGLVVSETTDYQPAAAGPLIGAASADAQSTIDILSNNRGSTPDVGARQLNPQTPLSVAQITAKSITGTNVTISGTATNSPTSGTASLNLSSAAYNNGVAQLNAPISISGSTWTVTFTGVKVGQYVPSVSITNGGGTASGTNNVGNIDVTDALGTLSAQTLDGQTLTVSGTTTGNPTSGTLYVPAAATSPNGAVPVGPVALTLGSGTFTATVTLSPGNYDPPVIQLTTANGTSMPLAGTTAISVIGVSGNPTAPDLPTAPPAVTHSVSVTLGNAAGAIANRSGLLVHVFAAPNLGTTNTTDATGKVTVDVTSLNITGAAYAVIVDPATGEHWSGSVTVA